MVTEFFLTMMSTVIGWAVDLVPESMAVPGWLQGFMDSLVSIFGAASTMGIWLPMDLAVLAAGFLLNVYIGGGLIKMIRILISHISGGGGSAA